MVFLVEIFIYSGEPPPHPQRILKESWKNQLMTKVNSTLNPTSWKINRFKIHRVFAIKRIHEKWSNNPEKIHLKLNDLGGLAAERRTKRSATEIPAGSGGWPECGCTHPPPSDAPLHHGHCIATFRLLLLSRSSSSSCSDPPPPSLWPI